MIPTWLVIFTACTIVPEDSADDTTDLDPGSEETDTEGSVDSDPSTETDGTDSDATEADSDTTPTTVWISYNRVDPVLECWEGIMDHEMPSQYWSLWAATEAGGSMDLNLATVTGECLKFSSLVGEAALLQALQDPEITTDPDVCPGCIEMTLPETSCNPSP